MDEYAAGNVEPPGAPFSLHTHGATDYPRWMAHAGGARDRSRGEEAEDGGDAITYAVEYNLWYEPYAVVNKTAWPGPGACTFRVFSLVYVMRSVADETREFATQSCVARL